MGSDKGVFVSNISPVDWVDDPDVPGSEMHELVHEDGVWDIASFPAGLSMTWHISTPFKELWFFS